MSSEKQKYSDQEIDRAINDLPDPGPARIAASVMHRVRQREAGRIRVRVREIGWGLAGSLVGVFLGFWIAGAVPDGSQVAASDDYVVELASFDDAIDQLAWEIIQSNGDEQ